MSGAEPRHGGAEGGVQGLPLWRQPARPGLPPCRRSIATVDGDHARSTDGRVSQLAQVIDHQCALQAQPQSHTWRAAYKLASGARVLPA